MGLLVSDMNTIGLRTMGAWPRTMGLSISDFNTITLSISDLNTMAPATIALGLTPNVRCSAARAGGSRAGGRCGGGGGGGGTPQ